jgi:hypothetical protein
MFASLFNNISPRNLINTAVVLFLLGLSYWLRPMSHVLWFPKEFTSLPSLNETGSYILISLFSIAVPFLFGEGLNRLHVFRGQYLSFLLAGILFLLLFLVMDFGPILWSIPLFLYLIFGLTPLLTPKSKAPTHVFGVALAIAAAGFLEGEAILLLLLPMGLAIAMRSFNARTVLALILGYGATLYFAFSIDYFFHTELLAQWLFEIKALGIFKFNPGLERLIPLILIGLFLMISTITCLGQSHHFNNEQKQLVNFWLYFLLLGTVAFLVLENGAFWLAFILLPTASMGALAIEQIKNKWLKDGLLLLPFLAILSFFVLT